VTLLVSHYYTYINYRSLFLTHTSERADSVIIGTLEQIEEHLSSNESYDLQRLFDKTVATRFFIKNIAFSKDGQHIVYSVDRMQKGKPIPKDFITPHRQLDKNLHDGQYKFIYDIKYFKGDKQISGKLLIELDSEYILGQINDRAIETTQATMAFQLFVLWGLAIVFFVFGIMPLYKMIGLAERGGGSNEQFWIEDISKLYKTMLNSFEELKNQKRVIVTEKNRLDTLLNTIPDLIWLKDTDGTYLFCNPMFERFFGEKESGIVGKSDYDFVDKELADFFRQKDKEAMSKGSPSVNSEWVTFADDGHRALLETIKTPLYGEQGQIIGVLGVARDVTTMWKAHEEIKELNKSLEFKIEEETAKRVQAEQAMFSRTKMILMGEVMGMVAHHWRQPLNALGITIQDMPYAFKAGEINEQYLKDAVESSMRHINMMSKTIDDFRNFFSPSQSKHNFCIEEAITSILNITGPSLKEYGIDVHLKLDTKHTIDSYESEFKQALLNLISNSKDAIIERGGELKLINITVEDRDGGLVIAIEDSGGGIPINIMDRIFEPYFSTKEQGKGTGIGLYMVRQLVERHIGGTITVSNGKMGARFEIRLGSI